ncbi:hypothetical protein D1641_17305, partial [Colidextribacter sp. OB.20]|uniref:hypothetical protein n=1 Tax=Colidextribacter sp. OB.20 TaxID=2304568 RepID=UPI0013687FFA
DGDDPTQIVLVEYDADGKLDNITTGRLSDMKNGLETTKNKETQKDSEGNTVTIETWAVVVKAKGSTGKDATTARVVYIVNRPVEFYYKDANDKTQTGYYDYSVAVEDGKFAVTVDAPKLGAGEVINEIIIRDADGKIIDRITKNIPEIVGGKISLIVPEDAAEIEFVTGEYVPPVDETKAAITVNFDAGVESVMIGETTVTTSGGKAVVTKDTDTDMTINLKKNFEIKDVAGATLKAENVYTINVSEDGAVTITTIDASQQVLTLAGLLGPKADVKVYVNGDLYSGTVNEEDKLAGVQSTYTVPADAKIVIKLAADSSITSAKTVKVGSTSVTLADGGAAWGDTIGFTMPKTALTLNMTAADNLNDGDNAAPEVITITLNGGVTAQYKPAGAGAEYADVVSGEAVEKGGSLKITGKGTGAAVVGALTVAGNSSGAASVADLATKALETVATDGTELTGTVDSSIELWSATVVKTTGTDVTAKGKVLAANDADASATKTNGIYIPVDTTLTIAGGDFDGYVVTNETGIMHAGESQATLTVTGADAWNIYGATKLSMGEGVQATYDTNKHPVDGDFVNAAQEVTFTAVKGDGTEDAEKVVVKDKADKGYGSAVTDPEVVDGDETYVAYTKVTLKINGGKLEIANPVITGKFLTILTGTSAADGDVIGIAKGTPIIITGSAAADEKIKVSEGATDKTSDYVIDGSDTIGTATSAPEASIEVGEKALTIEQA